MSEQKSFPLTRLRLLSDVIRRGISPTYADFGTPVANQKCVRPHGKFNVSHARNHDADTRAISLENFVQPGDALINSTGTGTLGRSTVISSIDSPLTWDSHITLVRPRKDLLESRFLAYVLQNSENRFITLSQGSTNQIELSRDAVSNLPIPAIGLPTQRRIADYLDRETAQIDAMAGALDGLVARLEERREAVVASAIHSDCGGVQGDAGMSAIALKLIAQISGGSTPSPRQSNWDGGYPFVTPPDLNGLDGAGIGTTSRTITESALSETRTISRGVLVSCRAPIGHIGTINGPVAFNQGCKAVRPDTGDLRFLSYVLVAKRPEMEALGRGTTFLEISGRQLGDLKVPWPNLTVQRSIADHLDAETAKIDAMIAKAGELRALLDERRSALITATVTGQHSVPEEP